MPTFKHPCPYCGKFIDRAVAACPFCGVVEPFSPKRCLNCRKIVEDPAWVVCPSCGMSLLAPPPAAAGTAATSTGAPGETAPGPTQPAAAQPAGAQPVAAAPPPPPAPAPVPLPVAPAPQSAGPCSGCGAPLPAGARFCTICGTMAG
jgi:RNA polymerase subunit RPABC4/transcription elongation factor Spt4